MKGECLAQGHNDNIWFVFELQPFRFWTTCWSTASELVCLIKKHSNVFITHHNATWCYSIYFKGKCWGSCHSICSKFMSLWVFPNAFQRFWQDILLASQHQTTCYHFLGTIFDKYIFVYCRQKFTYLNSVYEGIKDKMLHLHFAISVIYTMPVCPLHIFDN